MRSASVETTATPRSDPRPSASGRRALLAACVALAAAGCATSADRELPVKLRWPEPPEVTRIEYVQLIASAYDVTGPPGFWEAVRRFIGLETRTRGRAIVQPYGVAATPDGQTVYVSDFATGVIHVFDFANQEVRYLGLNEALARPAGIALAANGNLYVAEQAKQQIRVLDPQGRTVQVISGEKLVRPGGIALDEERGRLYVADPSHQNSKEHYVRIFDLDGRYLGEVGNGRGTNPGYLLFPTYVAVDASGNVLVSDTMNSRISIFDADGEFVRTVGSRGDGFGLFDKPKGLALDSFGNLYVVDSSWSLVQIFGPRGHVLLYFGGRGGYPGLLRNPTGIAIAQETNTIFVGDYLNRRLVVYRLVNTSADDSLPASDETPAPATP